MGKTVSAGAQFDPDAFMAKRAAATQPSAPATPTFDPDAFMARRRPAAPAAAPPSLPGGPAPRLGPSPDAAKIGNTLFQDAANAPAHLMDMLSSHPVDHAVQFLQDMTAARHAHADRAVDAYQKGDYQTAATQWFFGHVPILGPMLGAAADEYAADHKPEAIAHAIEILAPTLHDPAMAGIESEAAARLGAATTKAADITAAGAVGALKGAAKSAVTLKPYGRFQLPVPQPLAGAAAGGYLGQHLGVGFPAGAAVGAALPIVRDAIRGARTAIAAKMIGPELLDSFSALKYEGKGFSDLSAEQQAEVLTSAAKAAKKTDKLPDTVTQELTRPTEQAAPAQPAAAPPAEAQPSLSPKAATEAAPAATAPPAQPPAPEPPPPPPQASPGPAKPVNEALFEEMRKSGTIPETAEPGQPFSGEVPSPEPFKQAARGKRAANAETLSNAFRDYGFSSQDLRDMKPSEWSSTAETLGIDLPKDPKARQKLFDATIERFEGGGTAAVRETKPLADRLQDAADAAAARIKDRGTFSGNQLNMGLPSLADAGDLAIWGAAKIAKGTANFAQWSKEMLSEYGEAIRPQLRALYDKAKGIYERHVATTEDQLPNTRQVLSLYKQGKEGADWYAKTKSELSGIFEGDADKMVDFLAATSPNTTVASNVTLALKAYRQWKTGEPFKGYLPETVNSLNKAVRGEDFGGMKVSSFRANLHGDPMPVTVDRWIARAYGFAKGAVTDQQYKFIDAAITQTAKAKGMEPRQLQAAIWKAIKESEGKAGNTSEAFEGVVRRAIEKNPQLAALIKQGARGQ